MMTSILKKLRDLMLAFWVLLYVIFEELVWDLVAKPIFGYLRDLKLLHAVENKVLALNPLTLLILFLVLFIQVEGLGILALSLMAQGKAVLGIALYMAKLPIAAFTFWLFRISKETLMTFSWFKYSYGAMERLIDSIKASRFHQGIVAKVSQLKQWLKTRINEIKKLVVHAKEVLKIFL